MDDRTRDLPSHETKPAEPAEYDVDEGTYGADGAVYEEDDIDDNEEVCTYCGEPRRDKIGCCGENHWTTHGEHEKEHGVNEGEQEEYLSSIEAVQSAIIRRIIHGKHHNLLMKLGPDGVMDAAAEQAGAASGLDQGSLLNYGLDQYKKDVGYTPMVNSLEELQATPGYQFQLEQGLQGVNRSAAARGGLLSGANLKAINNYAQGQAATGYQAAWDRAQQAYANAFGRNQQKFQNLQSMAVNGQSAAGAQGQAALSVGQGMAGASRVRRRGCGG